MFANRISKMFLVLLVLVTALATVSFVTHSANISAMDRSYDNVEQVRAQRTSAFTAAASSYDQIETLRIQRSAIALAANSGYDAIQQLRLGRAFNAVTDHSYDQVETLRLQRTGR